MKLRMSCVVLAVLSVLKIGAAATQDVQAIKCWPSDRAGAIRVLEDGSVAIAVSTQSIVVFDAEGALQKEYDFGERSVGVALTREEETFANGCTAQKSSNYDVIVKDEQGNILVEWNFGPEVNTSGEWRKYVRTSSCGRYTITYQAGPERPRTVLRDTYTDVEKSVLNVGYADFTPDGSKLVAHWRGVVRFYACADFFDPSPLVKAARE